MRSMDWSQTAIGPAESWSPALRTMVRFLLVNRFQMLLWWGPTFCQLYNDAFLPCLGTKHPKSMGQPASECWPETWHMIGPLIETPFRGGEATWMEDIFLEIQRHGFAEETHWTIAYSPVADETAPGGIGGVAATVHEITEKVVGERRMVLLRDLSARSSDAKTGAEACSIATEALARHSEDVPFALLYLIDNDRKHARLAGTTGVDPGTAESPTVVDLTDSNSVHAESGEQPWPFSAAMRSEAMQIIEDLQAKMSNVPPGPWSDPPRSAVLYPIPSNIAHQFAGFLVLGISSRLRFDNAYRGFCELLTTQVATAIANARACEEERKRAEALAEIDRVKAVFVRNVSQEFRTPLTLMLGPIEDMLLSSAGSVTVSRDELDLVHRNCIRLLKLVNVLLDFSRIEAGRIKAHYEPTDLGSLTADLASMFRPAIEKAGLRLSMSCPPMKQPVRVDREMWEKIVLNLISNAFKFTFQGEIAVSLGLADGHAELSVRDTGIGIREEELPRVFERFHRVKDAQGRTFEGSGTGLALVQELAKLHAGTVRVESVYGQGTTFIVSIPLAQAGESDMTGRPVESSGPRFSVSSGARAYLQEALGWVAERAAEPDEVPGVSGANILLADDNADMRRYVQRMLMGSYHIDAVADGEAALAAARENPPDLVLSDILMPRLDGFGLLKALRADPRTSGVPVILLSARAGGEAQVEGLEAGADDYLVKPFSAKELRVRVRNLFTMKRTRDLLQRELASQSLDLAELTEDLVDSRRSQERTLRALQESEQRWRAVFENSAAGIALTDLSGHFQAVNAAYERMVGYTEEELRGLSIATVTHEDDRDASLAIFMDLLQTRQSRQFEKRYRRKDGGLIWASLNISLISDHNGRPQFAIAIAQDITPRKNAQEKLQESERRFHMLLESIPHQVWSYCKDGTLGYWNEQLANYTGFSAEQLRRGGWDALHPDDVEPNKAAWLKAWSEDAAYEVENRIRGRDGRYRRFVSRAVPVADPRGRPFEWFGTHTDVEERRNAQEALQKAQAELAHVTRLTTLGELSASIAHEVNQPLGAVVTDGHACVRWLNRPEPNMEEALAAVKRMIREASRASEVIARLRSMARKSPLKMVSMDMNQAITEVLGLVRHELVKSCVLVKTDLAPGLRRVRGDSVQFQQVLVNLILNAIESMNMKGEGLRELLIASQNQGQHEIVVQVRDSGVGIDPRRIDQIFQPFVTNKPNGMGMGLSVSRSILEAHGGRLWVAPNQGPGVTFLFALRAKEEPA